MSAACDRCGKVRYPTRSAAKRARQALRYRGLHIYPCPFGWGFHLGHLLPVVLHGHRTRGEVYGRNTK